MPAAMVPTTGIWFRYAAWTHVGEGEGVMSGPRLGFDDNVAVKPRSGWSTNRRFAGGSIIALATITGKLNRLWKLSSTKQSLL